MASERHDPKRRGIAAKMQGSISFLKKRNKKLLLYWLTRPIRPARLPIK
jgi:hypothetical protein